MNSRSLPLAVMACGLSAGMMVNSTVVSAADAAAPAAPQAPKWESVATAGLTLTQGNSDTLLVTLGVRTQKKWDKNELTMGVGGAYGESEGEKNNELLKGFVQYNRLFSERLFGYLRADAMHDGIADIEYRVALSPGAGYYFVKNDRTTLSVEVGPGWIMERQGGDSRDYFTLRVAQKFTHKISDTTRIWEGVEYVPEVNDFENFLINAEIGISTDISKSMQLTVVIQDTYDNVPALGLKENDLKLIAGVSYKF